MAAAAKIPQDPPAHVPVLLAPLLAAVAPVAGVWIDGTFGAGGYARGLRQAGAERVIGIDRDPDALAMADWVTHDPGITVLEGNFGDLDTLVDAPADGVVLDLGVSSMQLDRPDRGFSFAADGPLDMRMSRSGPSAADVVAEASEQALAEILYQYGEERASRRIARAIVRAREREPIISTRRLAQIVEGCLPPRKPGQSHPATRSFQALRIAVNDEFGELVRGLEAAERVLVPGGWLAVVSFHSLEDRVVKRFFQAGTGPAGANRHVPEAAPEPPRWVARNRGITADAEELAANPRSRSATLRVGRRTAAPARAADRVALGVPHLKEERG